MNLPAVILFVCFSAVYCINCKVGGKHQYTIEGKEEKDQNVTTKACGLCARVEYRYSGARKGSKTEYYCKGDTEECNGKKEDSCVEEAVDKETKKKVCCSKDPEFEGMPSLNSSPIVSPLLPSALLVIITALLGFVI